MLDDGIPVLERRVDRPIPDAAEIRERLDAGEAQSLLATVERDGTLTTDGLAVRRLAGSFDVPVTGSIGLLVLAVERDALDVETADEWLTTWRTERGYHAPVDSVEAVLDQS